MKSSIFKNKFIIILLLLSLTDLFIWRIGTSENKKIIAQEVNALIQDRKVLASYNKEDCRVSESKSFKTTSCSISTSLVIGLQGNMADTLQSVFTSLNSKSWDTNFEEFKNELIVGKSRFKDQCIRFYKDDYDPNGDHDFIDVCRIDNGLTVASAGLALKNYNDVQSNVIVIILHREQMSSLAHYMIGQFITF